MQTPTFDPGLTQKYTGALKRTIGGNGEFNVLRTGRTLLDWHPYLFLISTTWKKFILVVVTAFICTNVLFAALYELTGMEHLQGANAGDRETRFVNAFFFSTHTLTTVGYGNVYPVGPVANGMAALEALSGLLGFSVITGLMFGRFSRPTARVAFSKEMLVTPYQDGLSLQFRVVNRRNNNLLEMNAQLLLMTAERGSNGAIERKFVLLELERNNILFFPLTWTIVHPIKPQSPLYGKTREDLAAVEAELLVLLKGFDETFGQTVNTRHSYRHEEIVWGARFLPAFLVDDKGEMKLEVNKVGSFEPVSIRADLT